jgi:predicted RNase H-like HicB family nuclease
MIYVPYTSQVFEEDGQIVAVCLELSVSSFGATAETAVAALQEAVTLFLEECRRMNTLEAVLEEAGYHLDPVNSQRWLRHHDRARGRGCLRSVRSTTASWCECLRTGRVHNEQTPRRSHGDDEAWHIPAGRHQMQPPPDPRYPYPTQPGNRGNQPRAILRASGVG